MNLVVAPKINKIYFSMSKIPDYFTDMYNKHDHLFEICLHCKWKYFIIVPK